MCNEIPKIIHYCWFGGKEIPEKGKKCIESWKKYFPDYEIIQWNEENFDLNCCQYVQEAYKEKKWAHVSDYVRISVLHKFGGIYFDTDVEVIKDFSDILKFGGFMGYEREYGNVALGLGFGVAPKNSIMLDLLSDYENSSFYDENGKPDLYNTIVMRTNKILEKNNVKIDGNIQVIDGITIYPKDYFNPIIYETGQLNITENSHSIHWYDGSWMPTSDRNIHHMETKIRKIFNNKFGEVLCFIYRKSYRVIQYYVLKKKGD